MVLASEQAALSQQLAMPSLQFKERTGTWTLLTQQEDLWESDYQRHRQELKTHLSRRDYSGRLTELQLKNVDKLNRSSLFAASRKAHRTTRRVPLIVTYSNHMPDVHLGPVVQSVVSLTSSLRIISLTVLADSIDNILIFCAEKMWVAFFQQKISAYLRITRCKF